VGANLSHPVVLNRVCWCRHRRVQNPVMKTIKRGDPALYPMPIRLECTATLRVSDDAGRLVRSEELRAVPISWSGSGMLKRHTDVWGGRFRGCVQAPGGSPLSGAKDDS